MTSTHSRSFPLCHNETRYYEDDHVLDIMFPVTGERDEDLLLDNGGGRGRQGDQYPRESPDSRMLSPTYAKHETAATRAQESRCQQSS
jgi:hypothetical protein